MHRRALVLHSMFIVLVLAVSPAQTQRRAGPGFSLYARALLSDERKPAIKVSAHVPFSNLVFFKKGEQYEAKYRLYIRIFDKSGKNMLDSAVISKDVVAENYDATRSEKSSSTLAHEIAIAPGDYLVRCTVRVTNTHRAFSDETVVTVPDMMQSGVGVSKPRLFPAEVDTSRLATVLNRVKLGETVYAEQTDNATMIALNTQPAFEFAVYLEKAVRDSLECELVYEVVDERNEQVLYGRTNIRLSGEEDRFVASFNVDEWEPGPYVFNVKATVHNPTRAMVANLAFDLEFTRAMLTKYFDRTVAILSLIATASEIREFEDAKPSRRAEVWAAFWLRRDPSPGTDDNEALDEHWHRVRHANDNFATNEPGWNTDRGRIYIRHGEPDEEEVRTDPYVEGQYLVWHYYQKNLTFVFHDRFGLGEYTLTNSSQF